MMNEIRVLQRCCSMSGYNKVYAKTCSTWLLRVFGGMLFSPKVSVSLIYFGLLFTDIQLCLMAGEMNKCLSWSVFPTIELREVYDDQILVVNVIECGIYLHDH